MRSSSGVEPASGELPEFDPFSGGELLGTGPTTEAQKELLAVARMSAEAGLAHSEAVRLSFVGRVDPEALEAGVRWLYRRHEALRSTFSTEHDAFFVWDRHLEVQRETLSPGGKGANLAGLLEQIVREPFDPYSGPLFRAYLIQMGAEAWELVLAAHHLVCDGWSFGVLVGELAQNYRARIHDVEPELPEGHPFSQYAERERERISQGHDAEDVGFWKELFRGEVPELELPTTHPRQSTPSFQAGWAAARMDAEHLQGLRKLAVDLQLSLFELLLSGFYTLLHRLTRQNDLVVAVPSAGQAAAGMHGLVGHCVNVLPVRMAVDGSTKFSVFASRVGARLQEVLQHREFTLGRLMRTVHVPRDPARRPVASVMFNLDRKLQRELEGFPDAQVSLHTVPRAFEYFEIFLNVIESPEGLLLECQFNEELFDPEVIEEWLESYQVLLEAVSSEPHGLLAEVDWIPDDTLRALEGTWQGAKPERAPSCTVTELVSGRARSRPQDPAVRWGGGVLSYGELTDAFQRVAGKLATQDLGRGDLVAVCMAPGPDLPSVLLGLLRSGVTYLPLDMGDPPERLRRIVEDARPRAIIVDEAWEPFARSLAGADLGVCVLRVGDLLGADPPGPLPENDAEGHIAYVIYTSGSTGRPKGVRVSHRGVVNFLLAMSETLGVDDQDVIPAMTALSFDISVLEIFLPLVTGGTTAFLGVEPGIDPRGVARKLDELEVTLAQATPSTWSLLLESGWEGRPGLRVLAGGEALSARLASELLDRVGEVWNMYGPTETTVWSACTRIQPGAKPIPIGRPIANTVIHVLDPRDRRVPVGVPGEIVIGGLGVAEGYLNEPELTAARFVPDPLDTTPTRFFRTGDRGRWDAEGTLCFLGRTDGQVKIRGHRVELAEVEAALDGHAGVRSSVAAVQDSGGPDARLIAFYIPSERVPTPESELRDHVRGLLPGHMVPGRIAPIDRIPRSSAGKVDRNALPEMETPSGHGGRSSGTEPTTEDERYIAAVWEEVLGFPGIRLDDDFFEMGGHSILAVKVIARVDRKFGTDLGLLTLFEASCLGAFVERVQASRHPEGELWEEVRI